MASAPGSKISGSILDTIGHTPLVRINRLLEGITDATVVAKIETFNPGNSIKDRMALKMIEDAERAGKLKPGGTIIEGTSGNTGMGLAIVAVVKGYRCIFTTTDKQSKEKVDALKAFGADVIVCPTDVDPEDPRSYYSVSSRLEREIPNSWKANQYDNLSNTAAHYEQTGPEIWEQTDGQVTHLVSGVGTGGTITGVGRYLKERNPAIKVWGIDTYGSVFKNYKETGVFDKNEIYPYITEGIGEDFLPQNVDFSVIDHFEKVTDKDAAIMTRRITREEGIFAGNSAGAAMAGLVQIAHDFRREDLVVVIFHDHGSRYLAKMFNDEWMAAQRLPGGHRHDSARPGCDARIGRALRGRGRQAGRRRDPGHERPRLLADLHHPQRPRDRLAQRVTPLRRVRQGSRGQTQAGRGDHAAGVSVRGHLDTGGAAVDDDHARKPGGAGARLQDREKFHHHPLGHHPRVDVRPSQRTSSSEDPPIHSSV